jgi:DNA repair exonuclease SbcCD ATPase subunit
VYENESSKMEEYKQKIKEKRNGVQQLQIKLRNGVQCNETIKHKKEILDRLQVQKSEQEEKHNELEKQLDPEHVEELRQTYENYQLIMNYLQTEELYQTEKERYKETLQTEIQVTQKQIDKYKQMISECVILTDEKRKEYQKMIEQHQLWSSFLRELKQTLQITDPDELLNMEKEVNELIEKEEQTISENEPQIQSLQIDIDKEEGLYRQVQKSIQEGSVQRHNCPKCKTGLMIHKNTIQEYTINLEELRKEEQILKTSVQQKREKLNQLKKQLQMSQKQIQSLKIRLTHIQTFIKRRVDGIKIDYIETIEEEIQKDVQHKSKKDVYEKEIEKLNKLMIVLRGAGSLSALIKDLPVQIMKQREQLIQLQTKYKKMEEKIEGDIEEEYDYYEERSKMIQDELAVSSSITKQVKESQNRLESINKEVMGCEKGLSQMEEVNLEWIQNDIQTSEDMIVKYETNIEKLTKRSTHIQQYLKQLDEYRQYQLFLDRSLSLKTEEEVCVRALSVAEEFSKSINEAEAHYLQQTIQYINHDLEEFISSFFGDTINVTLHTFRETQDGEKKAEIDVRIIKDGEVVPIDGLSGGEYDRVSLAFFLAFNRASKCDFILLDECLASLHPELVEEIVDTIKEKMSDKLVMFTLHQANTGIFDEVIDICKYRCFTTRSGDLWSTSK